MTKRLVIFAALMSFCGGVLAQDDSEIEEIDSEGGGFLSGTALNTNNKFQISLMLGNAGLFKQDLSYVLPKYGDKELGFPSPDINQAQSTDPGLFVQLNNLGEGSIVNMAGLSFAYYITDGLDVNMSFGMDLRSTPKKDYVESDDAQGMTIQGSKWIEGRLQNNWVLSVGSNYHFKVTNEKIDFFGGVRAGYQHGQLTFNTPYTDKEYEYLTSKDPDAGDEVLYFPRSGAGQVHCITASIVAGVSYSLAKGLLLGLEFEPYSYQYSMLEVCPKGASVYQAVHYANRFFANPMLKLGFKF